jgi:cell division protein FtsW
MILFSTVLLLGLSVLMVFSTTSVPLDDQSGELVVGVKKHLMQVLLGLVMLGACLRCRSEMLYKISAPLLIVTLLLLVLVLIPGIGYVAGGARRWLILGPLRFQPGEIAKLAVVLYLAAYIRRHHEQMLGFVKGAVMPLGLASVLALLLLLEPDFGTTVIVFSVVFLQLMTVSNLKHLAALGVSAVLGLGMLVLISPYRFRRFESFLNPFADASASGYQLVQSLIAVGSGGLTGAGLGAGKQKLFYLPAPHTDFIFAVIAEELGMIGAASVVFLFVLFSIAGFSLARRFAADPFKASLAVGLTAVIVVPAFLNMAVVIGLLPTKGLVLPLVAYGGTAMVVNLSIVGMLLGLAKEKR